MHKDILLIGLIIFTAHLFEAVFKKIKIPDVLMLMLLGIVAGPISNFIDPSYFGQFGQVITGIALVVILFDGGTHLNLVELKKSLKDTVSISLITFIITGTVVWLFSHFILGQSELLAAITAVICGAISPAVVLPMIEALGLSKKAQTILTLETAITDVLAIILAFSLFQTAIDGSFNVGKVAIKLVTSLSIAGIIGVCAALAWSYLLKHVRQFENNFFTTFAFLFVLYGFTEIFHISGPITCLAFGFTISNIHALGFNKLSYLSDWSFHAFDEDEHSFFSEVKFLLKIFFFIYLGISFPLDNMQYIFYAMIISVLLIVFRIFVVRISASSSLTVKDTQIMSIMIPKGLASAVLASIAVQMNIEGAKSLQTIVYAIILWTILLDSVLVFLIEKTSFGNVLNSLLSLQSKAIEEEISNDEIIDSIKEENDQNTENKNDPQIGGH
jgi:potassium/hydrogen antiporter